MGAGGALHSAGQARRQPADGANVREVVDGLMSVLSAGCPWRAIPKDLPARSTLYDYFDLWSWDGTLDRIHDALDMRCREAASREASPTAAIIPGSKSPGTSHPSASSG